MLNISSVKGDNKIRNGLVIYASIVPAVALLIERYALNKYLGILLWAVVIVVRPVCCFFDRKALISSGAENVGHPALVLIPTVYIFKRSMLLRYNTALTVICFLCFCYGVIGNGFFSSMFVDNDTIVSAVKHEPMSSISEFKSFAANESLETAIGRVLKDVSYDLAVSGDERTVTISGVDQTDGSKLSFVFRIVHDGYTYTDFGLLKVLKNGSEISGDERTEQLKALFAIEKQLLPVL